MWYRTEILNWTVGDITPTLVSPVISLQGPRYIQVGLDMCVWVDVCLNVCQRSVEKLTSITAPTPPCTSSVYHNILLMKIHAAETKLKRIKLYPVPVCCCESVQEVYTCMYVQGFRRMEDLSTMDCTHVFRA